VLIFVIDNFNHIKLTCKNNMLYVQKPEVIQMHYVSKYIKLTNVC